MRRAALFILASIAFALPGRTASAAPDRVALVIGNGAYLHASKLVNPPNDAADVAAALRKLGFDVVEGRDLDKRGMESKVIEFSRKLDRASIALFFYAGHGMQVGGRNYLVPIDAKLERGGDLSFETLDVSQVLAQMEAEKRVNLVFLDACRDNPLARSLARNLGTRSAIVGQGLASIQGAVGTMIVYATQPDNVALDGDGTRNSPFTTALLKHIATPGLEIRSMMTRVRSDVLIATREKQVPWDHSSLTSEVTLTPALAPAANPAAAASPAPDDIAWSFLKDTNDANQLRRFVEQYPSSPHRSEAATLLLRLEQAKVAALPPANPASAPAAPQPLEPVRTSAITRGIDLEIGTEISSAKLSSDTECRDSCIKNKKCNAWRYYSASYVTVSGLPNEMFQKLCTLYDKGSFTKGKTGKEISVGVVKIETPTVASAARQPTEPVRTSAIVNRRRIDPTGKIITTGTLDSAAACRDLCLANKACKAWNYHLASYESFDAVASECCANHVRRMTTEVSEKTSPRRPSAAL